MPKVKVNEEKEEEKLINAKQEEAYQVFEAKGKVFLPCFGVELEKGDKVFYIEENGQYKIHKIEKAEEVINDANRDK